MAGASSTSPCAAASPSSPSVPVTRKLRITYSGNGYRSGYAEGERADIGGKRLRPGGRALTGGP